MLMRKSERREQTNAVYEMQYIFLNNFFIHYKINKYVSKQFFFYYFAFGDKSTNLFNKKIRVYDCSLEHKLCRVRSCGTQKSTSANNMCCVTLFAQIAS